MKKEELQKCATRIMLDIDDDEYEKIEEELNSLLSEFENASKLKNLDQVEPLVFPFFSYKEKLREDKVKEGLDEEEVLKNSSSHYLNQIKIPKVVD